MKNKKQSPIKNTLNFSINGEKHSIENPDPTTLLVDYLRSTPVGLTGTKHACGQGGCGSCTVTLSKFNPKSRKIESVSGNSCLRLLAACDGMEITTVEGIGSVNSEVSDVQYKIAKGNGSQCGYCTPGFVMNMHSLLLEKGGDGLSKKEIEQAFDGNICRCTGFRPILHAFKSFAYDYDPAVDEAYTPACIVDPAEDVPHYTDPKPPCSDHIDKSPDALQFSNGDVDYYRPRKLAEVHKIMAKTRNRNSLKLVAGNTSTGIPEVNPVEPKVMIDISQIKELMGIRATSRSMKVGALTTYTEFLNFLEKKINEGNQDKNKGLNALHYMGIRTAGKIVRNVASLAGNTMLVARNVKNGYPFPSDMIVALACLDSTVTISLGSKEEVHPVLDFIDKYNSNTSFAKNAVIVDYNIPMTSEADYVYTYKVAIRKENSHSLANAGFRIKLDNDQSIIHANLVLGGITTKPVHALKTQSYLIGKHISVETMHGAIACLSDEIDSILNNRPEWFVNMPTEGTSSHYRKQLLEAYLYKFFLSVMMESGAVSVPQQDASAPIPEFDRKVSSGRQDFDIKSPDQTINQPYIKLSAFEQATGEAKYTHDIPVPVKGVQGAFVTSKQAKGSFYYQIPAAKGKAKKVTYEKFEKYIKTKFPNLIRYFTYRDLPDGVSNGSSYQGIKDPYFCEQEVTCYGQSIGFVVCKEELEAINIANFIATECIGYNVEKPVVNFLKAIKNKQLFPGYNHNTDDNSVIETPGSDISWASSKKSTTNLDGQECQIIKGSQQTGSQIHFYMESQSCVSEPGEHNNITVRSSSQSPNTIQSRTAAILGNKVNSNNVQVDIKRLGGGYGGKTTRTPYVASPTSLASVLLNTTVRTAMPRDVDSYMIGNRHPFFGNYSLAVTHDGMIKGSVFEFFSDGGNTKDCSFDVMDCANLGSDNCYNVPNFKVNGNIAITNTSSNGAMRSYGGVQASLITEEAIEKAAFIIGMRSEDLREKNFYQVGDKTPYGQELDYCLVQEVWDRLKEKSNFEERYQKVQEFNANNKWKKRGISMIPLKYGMGYNLGWLMQGGALIDIYSNDGTILVSHGGIEMGQGIMTKMAQVAAQTLNVPIKLIQMESTKTATIPNPTGTGATSGSDLSGGAVQKACQKQRRTLEAMCLKLLKENGNDWCVQHGINFWDHKETGGWQTVVTATTSFGSTATQPIWNFVVGQAQVNRVSLSAQALYGTPGLKNAEDQQFYGYTYSAACSEVEIDVLTGESNVLRTDIVYDIGKSLNPAIDVGQIEGAFVMGLGYVLMEDVIFEPNGTPNTPGKLNTPNTWTYKPPCAASIPIDFRVDLFPRDSASEVPENPNLMMQSKGVGEPPLVLSSTVFFAVKKAIIAARQDRGNHDWFEMSAPATVEKIRKHCQVNVQDLTLG